MNIGLRSGTNEAILTMAAPLVFGIDRFGLFCVEKFHLLPVVHFFLVESFSTCLEREHKPVSENKK
jgi:hypothetical protein